MLDTNRAIITLSGYATNIYSAIDPPRVYISTNGGGYTLMTNHTNWTTNFNTAILPDGTNYYTFLAVSSNFKSNTYAYSNIVDNSEPYLAIESPSLC